MKTNFTIVSRRYGMQHVGCAWAAGRTYAMLKNGKEYNVDDGFTQTKTQVCYEE
jgi:hypothetical protein